jgi:hypothetical protein
MVARHEPERVTLSDFAADPGALFDRVIRDNAVVIIEDASGARAELRPAVHDEWPADADVNRPPTPEEVARSRAGTQAGAGSWRGLVEVDAFKAYLAARRRIRTRPHVRLGHGICSIPTESSTV